MLLDLPASLPTEDISEVSSVRADKPDLSGDTPNTVDSHFGYINNTGNPLVSHLSWVSPWVFNAVKIKFEAFTPEWEDA